MLGLVEFFSKDGEYLYALHNPQGKAGKVDWPDYDSSQEPDAKRATPLNKNANGFL